uniref:Putative secreted protein n=1 Tax=Ixodes ricinus TaxID=34613 RepID=A0A6B0U972_IXORI
MRRWPSLPRRSARSARRTCACSASFSWRWTAGRPSADTSPSRSPASRWTRRGTSTRCQPTACGQGRCPAPSLTTPRQTPRGH